MGNVIVSVEDQSPLGSGLKIIRGTIAMSSAYATGGDALNLVNYLYNSATPFVSFGGGDNVASAEFYTPAHDGGTVESGKVRLLAGSAGAGETKSVECNNAKNTALINVSFIAIGRQL